MTKMSSGEDTGTTSDTADEQENEAVRKILKSILSGDFHEWYEEKKAKDNLKDGKPYYNEPSSAPDPKRHSPSSLLQCSRKIYYRQLNAPEESEDPHGIFWLGSKFEEKFVLPYLEDIVPNGVYVGNSYWVDFTVETEEGEIRFRGETDPVIVAEDGRPLVLVEVKTKSSVSNLEAPNRHHRAQVHPYLYGLSQQYSQTVTDAIILYGSRDTFETTAFHVEFDPLFWKDIVLNWAIAHTESRTLKKLPSANPGFEWECEFCSYRQRCGKTDLPHSDIGPTGLLPLYDDYPRQKLIDYLEAHEEAQLTPTLAYSHPDLAERYGVYHWVCASCGDQYDWREVEFKTVENPPFCEACGEKGRFVELAGPDPSEQQAVAKSGGDENG